MVLTKQGNREMKKLMVLLVGLFAVLSINADDATINKIESQRKLEESKRKQEELTWLSPEKKKENAKTLTDIAIIGAFGFNLDTVMDETELKKVNARFPHIVNGYITYVVNPPERFSTFQEYVLTITPDTKRIASIRAVVTAGGSSDIDLVEFKSDLYSALKSKYGAFCEETWMAYNKTMMAIIVDKSNLKRKIIITSGPHSIYLEYVDEEILKSEKKPNIKAL